MSEPRPGRYARGMRRGVIIALALGLLAAPAASAKELPSFERWSAQWTAQSNKTLDELSDKCIAIYGESADQKVGECFIEGMQVVVRKQIPGWERAVARVAKGQTKKCKSAIHAYWRASRKGQKALLSYLDSHPDTSATQFERDIGGHPFGMLKERTDKTKSKAIRVCG